MDLSKIPEPSEEVWWAFKIQPGITWEVYRKKPRIEMGEVANSERWLDQNYVGDLPNKLFEDHGITQKPYDLIPIRPLRIERVEVEE